MISFASQIEMKKVATLLRVFAFLVQIFMITGLISCDRNRIFEKDSEIENQVWSLDQSVEFTPIISDTLGVSNVYLNIRNTDDYSYSNLFLFITTTAPTGYWIIDTVEIVMTDKRGKWTGSGFGGAFYNQKLFKANVRFPYPGSYSFKVEHGMREKDLKGIRDVGLRIEIQE